ncbi:hypothetical protein IC582_023291 [Cucumis melo]|uniref:Large ribosomal subunit protein bL12 C-terminal domain-containing protein n=1 Tax=Cucumis melo TaxID=3656 RepID=A0A9I9D234_CUCME
MAWTLVPKVEGGGAAAGSSKAEEKEEKTAFDVKLEKFDSASKIKVIKEVRSFTNLGLKEAKDLVEKVPAILKQGVTKEEANDIIEKIKAAGGVAVMEVVKCSKVSIDFLFIYIFSNWAIPSFNQSLDGEYSSLS